MNERVYLDHAASAPLVPVARTAMLAAYEQAGNPSSLHASGRAARRIGEAARDQPADGVGAPPSEVIFTSGGTEADNLAVLGTWRLRRGERPAVVASAVEHPAVLETRTVLGDRLVLAEVDEAGRVRPEGLVLGPDVAVVSVQWVNNETGVVQPVAGVVDRARAAGVVTHSDAVQALGHVPVDFAASGLDLMSLSAHKVGGPVGIGALVARRSAPLAPIGFGGGQERRVRSGTVAAALAAGFAAAATEAVSRLDVEAARLRALAELLVERVRAVVPDVVLNSVGPTSPHIVNLGFPGCGADDLLLLLDQAGIDASTGSACTAGVHQPSHVLEAMGRPAGLCRGSLRFSFGPTTTPAHLDAVVAALPDAVARARQVG